MSGNLLMIRSVLLLFTMAVIIGCSTVPNVERTEIIYRPGQVNLLSNEEKQTLYKPEIDTNVQYNIGVSLSGGGMRSASFTMGALAGLMDSGVLQQTDFLSSVSGGGYTGYWLLSNLYFSDLKNTNTTYLDYFNDCYPVQFQLYKDTYNYLYSNCVTEDDRKSKSYMFQNQVAQQSDLLNYYQDTDRGSVNFHKMRAQQWSEFVGVLGAQVGSLIPHHLGNTLFDWSWNVSAVKNAYQHGIERAFGLVPIDLSWQKIDDKKYHNSDSLLWMDNYGAQKLSFDELRIFTKQQLADCSTKMSIAKKCIRPPVWIINSTAGVANMTYEWLDKAPLLSDSVFEISPLMYGSGEYGYSHTAFNQLSVSESVSASGAALDIQFTSDDMSGWTRSALAGSLHLINVDLGESIENYNPESANQTFHNFLPFPLYYLHGFSRNKNSTDIYLSDGGHSENLGAYSLIVRGIKNVIIIDAEHDSKGKWGALTLLASNLKKEHGLELSISGKKLIDDKNNPLDKVIEDPLDASENIYVGRVTGFRDGFIKGQNYINIIYVKSSLVKRYLSPDCSNNTSLYPCSTFQHIKRMFWTASTDGSCKQNNEKNPFPNHSTAYTAGNMSLDIYFAYRDLARHITRRISVVDGNIMISPLPDVTLATKPSCL